jgi:methyl-accepting chemotaxis protein
MVSSLLEEARTRAASTLVWVSWALLPLIGLAAWLAGNSPVLAVGISAAFSLAAHLMLRTGGSVARAAAAQAIVGQAIALTAGLAGHPWQVDMHMTFFAALAVTIALADRGAILLAAGTVLLHHLALSLFLPALVYPSVDLGENVARTLVHGAILAARDLGAFRRCDGATSARCRGRVARDTARDSAAAEAEAARQAADAARERRRGSADGRAVGRGGAGRP